MTDAQDQGWYVARGGQQQGPMALDAVRQMMQRGELAPTDYVAGPGVSGWTAVSGVPSLAPPAAPAAPGGFGPPAHLTGPSGPAPTPGASPSPGGFGPPAHLAGPAVPAVPGPGFGPAPSASPAGFGAPGGFGSDMPAEPQSSWWKERLKALLIVGGGVLLILANVGTIMINQTFYPKLVAVAGGCLCFGGWQIAFGDDKDDYTMETVRWKTIGQWVAGGLGAAIGFGISMMIAD